MFWGAPAIAGLDATVSLLGCSKVPASAQHGETNELKGGGSCTGSLLGCSKVPAFTVIPAFSRRCLLRESYFGQ
jgi:hypothetical protein